MPSCADVVARETMTGHALISPPNSWTAFLRPRAECCNALLSESFPEWPCQKRSAMKTLLFYVRNRRYQVTRTRTPTAALREQTPSSALATGSHSRVFTV